jgi:hypothetical protein
MAAERSASRSPGAACEPCGPGVVQNSDGETRFRNCRMWSDRETSTYRFQLVTSSCRCPQLTAIHPVWPPHRARGCGNPNWLRRDGRSGTGIGRRSLSAVDRPRSRQAAEGRIGAEVESLRIR